MSVIGARFRTIVLTIILLIFASKSTLISNILLNFGFTNLIHAQVTQQIKSVLYLQQAERAFRHASQYPETYRDAQRGLGFAFLVQGDDSKSADAWQRAKLPVEDLLMFGENAEKQSKKEQALVFYRCAAHLDFAAASDNLAKALYIDGKQEEAIQVWQRSLEEFPHHPNRLDWWHGLVRIFFDQRRLGMAIKVAQKGLEEYPNDAELLAVLGRALYMQYQDVEAAERLLKQAIANNENFAEAYGWMGHIMAAEQRPDEAYDWYRQAYEHSGWYHWRLLQANMARSMGDAALAITLYLQLVEDNPKYGDAYYEMALAYVLLEDVDMAVQTIQEAIRISPDDGRYYFRAGKMIEKIEDPSKIMRICQEIAEINPDNPLIKEKICQ